jgi:hypothetical protein
MAFIHGKVTVVSVGGTDMSIFGTSAEYELKSDSHDVTAFGADFHVYSGGLKDSTLKLEGTYDDTADDGPRAALEILVGDVTELIYNPEGAGSGKPIRTWNALLTSYTETAPVADMVKFAAQFQGAGAVVLTEGT